MSPSAPTFVILQDRGQKLRFVKPQYLRLRDGALREFLTTELYNDMPPWDGPFAPGGSQYVYPTSVLVCLFD